MSNLAAVIPFIIIFTIIFVILFLIIASYKNYKKN